MKRKLTTVSTEIKTVQKQNYEYLCVNKTENQIKWMTPKEKHKTTKILQGKELEQTNKG